MPPNSNTTTSNGRKPRYFYGWNIVAASFLAQLSYAEHFSSLLGFFFKPFQTEFGWSRSAIAAVQSIARVAEAAIAPFLGPFIDRYGPRVLMPIGAAVVGCTMLALTRINARWQFYLLRGVITAIGFTIMGALVSDIAINNWFIRKRGRALAISRLGGNISNVIFTPLTVFVLASSGWQTMFVIFAVVTWIAVLIPTAVLMRRRPEDMGLFPDGIQPRSIETKNGKTAEDPSPGEILAIPEPLWNRQEVLKSVSFWLLALSLGINSLAFQGINISLAPYIQDLGYGETMLATVMTFRAAMAAGALPFVGFLAEHCDRLSVRIIPFIVQGVAILLLLAAKQPVFLWLGIALYGLGISAIGVTQEAIWANYFGRLSLGVVRSLSYLVSFGFGAVGPIAINYVFDILGSYQPAFIVIIVFFAMSAFVMGIVKPPKAHRFATAAELG